MARPKLSKTLLAFLTISYGPLKIWQNISPNAYLQLWADGWLLALFSELEGAKKETIEYSEGDWKTFEGFTVDGTPNGLGTVKFVNGDKYDGELRNGQIEGSGIMTFNGQNNKESYTGEFKDGKRHGRGKLIFRNGNYYDGEMAFDKYQGNGTYAWPTGHMYIGEWVDDNRTGYGKYVYNEDVTHAKSFNSLLFEMGLTLTT